MSNDLIEEPYPFQQTVGFAIEDWRDGNATLRLPLKPHLGNRYGILHGGVHATLLDTAMGFAVSYTGDADNKQLVMTLSLNVNYLGVATGDELIAIGHKTGGGRSTAFAEGRIEDTSGNIIATATAVFRYRGKSKSGETT
ncbi:PaaI family thioesterase [Lentibacter algarum]|uniref:PaaI family thioesterase n=1 Tax=Lentibacter algarum TaxID=576131 RepID=UPI001C06B4B5|nr:PaaI family thioesterase [Lentibacter algarum]MBU2981568.1 PaaI family thioesterase [Lentibacter algarum]